MQCVLVYLHVEVKVIMDDDVCHDRQCWASVNGEYVGDVLEGGRVDATNLNRFRAASVDAVGSLHFSKYEAHDLSLTSKSRAAAASAGGA